MDRDTKIEILIVSLALTSIMGGCYGGSHIKRSGGFRDGVIVKMSDTGLIFTTTEVTMRGGDALDSSTYYFTVISEDVKQQITSAKPGQRVRVFYDRKLTWWEPNGESRYFITKIELQ